MFRRDFQRLCCAAAATSLFPRIGALAYADQATSGARTTNPIGLSTYSLWRFKNDQFKEVSKCIDYAGEVGFDGVEILLYQISQTEMLSNAACQALKRKALLAGLTLYGMSTHQGFVSPDPEVRRMNIELTIGQIELCYKLGIPTMRVNTGRWGTSKNFDELMANRGIEPPLP